MVRVNREALGQAGVVPYRYRKQRVEIALVTTSGGGHWIIPKGRIDPGESASESASREAEEEAGLRGVIEGDSIGSYVSHKTSGAVGVHVFLMRVTQQLDHWLEDELRDRRWVSPEEAAKQVREPDLARILNRIRKLVDRRHERDN